MVVKLDVIAKLDVVALLELTEKLDVVANEEVTAYDALVIVPVKDPLNEPVLICTELLTNPAGLPVILFQSDAPPPPPFAA